MSAVISRAAAARAGRWITAAAIMAAGTIVVSGCGASQYQRVSCTGTSPQTILVLSAQAVPSATQLPCANPLPGGWSVGGFEVRSGLVQFWLDSDRAGAGAAEATLTRTCDVAAATPLAPINTEGGLVVRYQARATQHATVRYYLFAGGCVTYRLSFTHQSAPALVDQADRFLGFTPRVNQVRSIRRDQGLTLCGADAPPCPG